MNIRKYRLENIQFRNSVNLTKYADLITKCVNDVNEKVTVKVVDDGYFIYGDISHREKILIGRSIAATILGKYSKNRPVLFRAVPQKESSANKNIRETKKQRRRKDNE